MKKLLLLGAAVLMVTSASAQLKRAHTTSMQRHAAPKVERIVPDWNLDTKVATGYSKKNVASKSMAKAPRKSSILDVWYTRPAGVFGSGPIMKNGLYYSDFTRTIFHFKPFKDYTFHGNVLGAEPGENLITYYEYYIDGETDYADEVTDLVIEYPFYTQEFMPKFAAGIGTDIDDIDARGAWFNFQSMTYDYDYKVDPPMFLGSNPNIALAVRSWHDFTDVSEDERYFVTARDNSTGGWFGNEPYSITKYGGLKPFDPNEGETAGNWFGKNAGTTDGMSRIDGIAQAFEKPEHPYLLSHVGAMFYMVNITAPVELTCKVYKLDSIPSYREQGVARLPAEPGELIATGTCTATPEMVLTQYNSKPMLLDFPLMGYDPILDMPIEMDLTIDYPILVVLDNYNDEGLEALTSFSAVIDTYWDQDEGFGEMAYLKIDDADEEGTFHGDYLWYGLNNLFGEPMKTSYSIYLSIEQPFITTMLVDDDEYTFPDEGGQMFREYQTRNEQGEVVIKTMDGVGFISSYLTAEDDWYVTWNDEEEMPDWLHLTLYDDPNSVPGEQIYYNTGVSVTADPLPEGVTYREAKIRFEIPGDYFYYTFKQGEEPQPQPGNRYDVNEDGEVSVADINYLIQMILSNNLKAVGDVNQDGEVSLADVNDLINYILNH